MANTDLYVSFGADTGGLEAAMAVAKAEVSDLTREINKLGREMQSTGAGADSALATHLRAVGVELAEAKERAKSFKESLKPEGGEGEGGFLAGLKEHLEGALGPLSELRQNLGEMVELVAAAFAIEKIADWISETTEAAEKFERMAAKLGIGVEQVQSLSAVAKLTGSDVEQMTSQLEKLQLSLAKTGEKASPAAAALKVLGINLAEFRRASIAGQVDLMAEAFSRFADGSGKTAAAMALLGKTGADMIPFLDKGKEGLDELRKASEATGAIMSEQTIAAFSKTREDLNELSLAWTGLSQKIYALVNPAVDAATKALTHLIESADPRALQGYLTTLATSLVGGAANVATFAVQAEAEWDKLVAAIAGAVPTIVGDLQKVADVLNGLTASFKLSAQEQAQWASGYANLWHNLGLTSDETHDKAIAAARALYQSGQDGAAAFGGLDAAGARTSIRLSDIASGAENAKRQIAALLAEGAKQSEGPAGEGGKAKPQVPQMQIGGAGKADNTARDDAEAESKYELQLLQQNAQATTDALNKELAEKKITTSQWLAASKDALADEAQDVQATYAAEMKIVGLTSRQIIDLKREEAAKLKEIAHEVAQDEDKAAKAAVASWKGFADTVAGAINGQIDGLLKGTETFAEAFRNVMASAIEDIIKELIKMAAEWAVLNIIAPGLGSSGLGSLLHIPGFATGTNYVPQTGLALLHQGEAVIPAAQNNGGYGGVTHNHTWNITGGPNASARDIAREVRNMWNSQPSLRPAY